MKLGLNVAELALARHYIDNGQTDKLLVFLQHGEELKRDINADIIDATKTEQPLILYAWKKDQDLARILLNFMYARSDELQRSCLQVAIQAPNISRSLIDWILAKLARLQIKVSTEELNFLSSRLKSDPRLDHGYETLGKFFQHNLDIIQDTREVTNNRKRQHSSSSSGQNFEVPSTPTPVQSPRTMQEIWAENVRLIELQKNIQVRIEQNYTEATARWQVMNGKSVKKSKFTLNSL